MANKKNSSSALWIIVLFVLVFAAFTIWQTKGTTDSIPFSLFQEKWKSNEIESIVIRQDKMQVQGKTRDNKIFTTNAPDEMINSLLKDSPRSDVKIEYEAPSNNVAWLV